MSPPEYALKTLSFMFRLRLFITSAFDIRIGSTDPLDQTLIIFVPRALVHNRTFVQLGDGGFQADAPPRTQALALDVSPPPKPRPAVFASGAIKSRRRALGLNQPPHPLHERIGLHRAFALLLSAHAYVDLAGFHLLVADDELERHLLHGVLADLGVHFLVAHINMHANTGGLQLVADFVRVCVVLLADRYHDDLRGREPHGKRSRVMLDEHAEETLDRAVERAVHHERLVPFAVFADVLQPEALGQGKVELHG